MGSGTTAIVAERLGRDWLGIELKPEYVEVNKNDNEGRKTA
jgi:DNA modification methylase